MHIISSAWFFKEGFGLVKLTSAYGLSAWMLNVSEGVAAAYLAAADSEPIFPQSYEFTPH
jgi:hypothetical protein